MGSWDSTGHASTRPSGSAAWRSSLIGAAIVGAITLMGCGGAEEEPARQPASAAVRACAEAPGLCRYGVVAADASADCTQEPNGCDRQPQASGPVHPARDCDWQVRFRGITAGVGVRFTHFQVLNRSSHTCRLAGVPTVELLDDQGRVVAAPQHTDTSVDTRPRPLPGGVVAAHGWGVFTVSIGNDNERRGETRRALLVRLPRTRPRHRVELSVPGDDRIFDPAPRVGFSVTRIGTSG